MPPSRQTATETLPEFSEQIVGANRYHLQDKLGSGAYGKVYRALDLLYKPKPVYCAVKVLHCHPPGSKREKTQLREIVLQAKVSGHPNIVSLLDFFTNPLYLFVVLELCAGGDLFSAITEKGWYQDKPARIKATFLQILDGVQHCHERHIFHRDIKPENILCSLDGATARLADFGLSTTQRLSKEFGCGSSYYMSPECIGDGPEGSIKEYSTPHNDIWALGIIFTNLATSRNPWRYATADDGCFAAF
ncbi:kinase-like domain-containing protein, partial [Coprinopsis sp. MPI-PUGE-AT-0042]